MIESNAVIIFDNDSNLIRKTVPGHDVNDVDPKTGDPRRIVYHWPNVYEDPATTNRTPDEPPATSRPSVSNGVVSGPHPAGIPLSNGHNTIAGKSDNAIITMSVAHH